MKINSKVEEANFKITDKVEIRYKKGYGFWLMKEIDKMWYVCTNSFRMNPYGIGFKKQYGFGYEDLKPFFFKTFDEALFSIDKVDVFEYWEYNKETHEKILDTILLKGRFENIVQDIVKNKDVYLNKIGGKKTVKNYENIHYNRTRYRKTLYFIS